MAIDRASLSKVVSDQIRGQILDGRLKPGERLVEDRLSLELGVSRVPVREALRGLSMEGLVRLEPNRGASVTASHARAGGRAGRGAHAPGSAERPPRRPPPRSRRSWPCCRTRSGAATPRRSRARSEQLAHLNAEFHERLAEASRNSVLSDIMRSLARAHQPRLRRQRPRPRARGLEGACRHPGRRDRGRRGDRGPAGRAPRAERRRACGGASQAPRLLRAPTRGARAAD